MKKISLLLAIALVAAACQPDLPPLPSDKPAAKPGTTTATTGSTTGSTTAAATSTTGTTPPAATGTTAGTTTASSTSGTVGTTTPDTKPQPGDIANRIFQLRQLAHTTIAGGNRTIDAFVADDDVKAAEGLMWVTDKDLKDDQGMIFIMSGPQVQKFWMQNTLIPLDIVYIATDGKVVNVVHGKPKDETSLPSTGPAQYVLELKDGMAAKYRIAAGTKLTIPTTLKYRGEQPPPGQQGSSFAPPQ
jgi:uncharacterized membrane protein (UPF0127 family)